MLGRLMQLFGGPSELFRSAALQGFVDISYARDVCEAIDGRHLSQPELQVLRRQVRLRMQDPRWGDSSKDQVEVSYAIPGRYISPKALRAALFGHIDYTPEQLEALAEIPYTRKEVIEEVGGKDGQEAILFPGHPSINAKRLYDIFWHDRHRTPYFGGVSQNGLTFKHGSFWWFDDRCKEIAERPLELRWYLVRTSCEPYDTCDTDTHRQTWLIEALMAALLLYSVGQRGFVQRRVGTNVVNGDATIECRERSVHLDSGDVYPEHGVGLDMNEHGQVDIKTSSGHGSHGPLWVRRLPDGS